MKFRSLLCLAGLVVAFTACSKDNSASNEKNAGHLAHSEDFMSVPKQDLAAVKAAAERIRATLTKRLANDKVALERALKESNKAVVRVYNFAKEKAGKNTKAVLQTFNSLAEELNRGLANAAEELLRKATDPVSEIFERLADAKVRATAVRDAASRLKRVIADRLKGDQEAVKRAVANADQSVNRIYSYLKEREEEAGRDITAGLSSFNKHVAELQQRLQRESVEKLKSGADPIRQVFGELVKDKKQAYQERQARRSVQQARAPESQAQRPQKQRVVKKVYVTPMATPKRFAFKDGEAVLQMAFQVERKDRAALPSQEELERVVENYTKKVSLKQAMKDMERFNRALQKHLGDYAQQAKKVEVYDVKVQVSTPSRSS